MIITGSIGHRVIITGSIGPHVFITGSMRRRVIYLRVNTFLAISFEK